MLSTNIYIRRCLDKLDVLSSRGQVVALCWIPSHVGIPGNEVVDKAAREAIDTRDIQPILQPHTDSRQPISQYVRSRWQEKWDEVGNDLHKALPLLPHKYSACLPRREERVMARIHIGHTRFTHSYRLDRTARPQCETCQEDLTIEHILVECPEFDRLRTTIIEGSTLAEIFETTPANAIVNFFKQTDHYYLI